MPLAFIHFLDGTGRPDNSLPGGGGQVDNTLPIPNPPPGTPGHLPSVPVNWPVIPSHPIARPPIGGPVDPGYGIPDGSVDNTLPIPNPPPGQPGHLPSVPPGWPIIPTHPIIRPPHFGHPDQGLPGEIGTPEHPIVLPPSIPPVPVGSYLVLVRNPDGTWAYKVVAGPRPDQALPPGSPGSPSQPIAPPPTAQPKS